MTKLTEATRDKLPASDFAEPKERAYPIEDASHAKNAKARTSQAVKFGRMSKAEAAKIDKKADAVIAKDLSSWQARDLTFTTFAGGTKVGLPEVAQTAGPSSTVAAKTARSAA